MGREFDSTRYDLVISYDAADRNVVARVAKRLRESGLRAWFDMWDLLPGMSWIEGMMDALNSTRVIVRFVGAIEYSRADRAFVDYESGIVGERFLRSREKTTVIPVILPLASAENLPESLKLAPYLTLKSLSETELDQLVSLLCVRVNEINHAQPAPRIFLCHAKEDDAKVRLLFDKLRAEKLDPWYDKENLDVGDRWEDEIVAAIEKTDFFAICLSKVAVTKRGFIQKEIRAAIREFQRRAFDLAFLLPIRFEECDVPNIRIDESTTLQSIQWADLFPGDDDAFQRFVRGVRKQWDRQRN